MNYILWGIYIDQSRAVRYDVIYHSFPINSQYCGHFVFA